LKEGLPETLLFETMVLEDLDQTEWIGTIAKDPKSNQWYLKLILKDGEPWLIWILSI
jgi:hypothetical protein